MEAPTGANRTSDMWPLWSWKGMFDRGGGHREYKPPSCLGTSGNAERVGGSWVMVESTSWTSWEMEHGDFFW